MSKTISLPICLLFNLCIGLTGVALPEVHKGPEIHSIKITGSHAFSRREILSWMETKPGEILDESLLRGDVQRILDRYISAGYWKASVQEKSLLTSDGKVDVLLTVEEGEQVRLGALHIQGNRLLGEDEILRRMGIHPGTVLKAAALEDDIEGLLEFYEKNGYPFCQISLEFSLGEDGRIDLALRIDEGPRVAIEDIRVVGNRITQERVIRRELRIKPGQIYDQREIERAQRRLLHLGFFERIDGPEVLYDLKARKVVLVVRVKERKTSRLDGAVGYVPQVGDGYLTGLVDISFANLLGTGRRLNAKWSRKDPDSSDLDLRYEEPWILGWPVKASGGFRQVQRLGYVLTGLKTSFEMPISEALSGEADLGWEKVIPDSLRSFEAPVSRTWIVGLGVGYDTRDDRLNPAEGIFYQASINMGIRRNSPTLNFIPQKKKVGTKHYRVDLNHFLQILPGQVLAIGLHGEKVQSGGGIIPLSEKLRLGGTNTLRGYREEQFSGDGIAWANLEYRHLISKRSRAFGFVDVGYFSDRRRQGPKGEIRRISAVKAGYGVGLRVESRIGIVGIDYGLGQGDGITEGKIHFRLVSEF